MNPLKELQEHGQSIWLDYIRRSLITSGELERLIKEDGLRGVTSNPTIFEKAIAGSKDYDDGLRVRLGRDPHTEAAVLFETLAVEDIQKAADAFRPVYESTQGTDGFVSLEVSPRLAHDTEGTLAEARRLWKALARPNVMIKVPATPEGIPAITALIAEGISVNVTLMFSLAHYDAVAQAYLRGLERCTEPQRVASVASFFVSRVDTAVDRKLETVGSPDGLSLRGRIAIANSKRVYKRFQEIFSGEPFAVLRERGARVQRPLWASTGTKNPAYSDVLYVEELIGRDTVNTVPPATLDAFRDHGRVRTNTIEQGQAEAEEALGRLAKLGIDLKAITEKLQVDGVSSFAASYEKLLGALEEKHKVLLAGQAAREQLSLGIYQSKVQERLQAWQKDRFACRLWQKDTTLWFPQPVPEIADRLGWLNLPEGMHEQLDDLDLFAQQARAEDIRHVVLLGMGGSSLAPEVLQQSFAHAPGYPELIVLDSTHPAAVLAVEKGIGVLHTLFLVSSKSGTTSETLSFFRYFWERVSRSTKTPGRHFVAITDPGTPLEKLARERKFRRIFLSPADVGGRYSALSVFGLVPAALIGVDVHRLLDRAWRMAEASAFCVAGSDNPGLTLGATLGELALARRDKVTFLAPSSLSSLPAWIEQLIAESTGKDGKGILPVAGEPLRSPDGYDGDRLFVHLWIERNGDAGLLKGAAALEAAGHPVVRLNLSEMADLGQEFFRWEVAIAAAGAVLGIHPFNQPDVQLAKELARQAMDQKGGTGKKTDSGAEPVKAA
ncbi:bifunctional transaldolase/phosoglucose isomerase, partial [Acidobacteriia bacterium AH_259_A11_L15]|nr:bifunctional transaldolase/phosoglucose isomerase [Acidobacteriia bacterium AH_259_A11_L15]